MGGKTAVMREQIEAAAAPAGKRWFVVQCHNQQERLAKAHLVNQGFEVYLPMRLCPHPKARHPITPFFPRYLFIRFDPDITQWMKICSTVGVHALLLNSQGKPAAVPDRMIGRIQEWEIDGVIDILGKPKDRREGPVFKPGDKVTIKDGPFAGLEALVRIVHDNDRVTVMLGLVSRFESALKLQLQSGALKGAALR